MYMMKELKERKKKELEIVNCRRRMVCRASTQTMHWKCILLTIAMPVFVSCVLTGLYSWPLVDLRKRFEVYPCTPSVPKFLSQLPLFVVYPMKVIEDPMAETCWEKRVFTSIKINRKLDSDRKENVVEIDPLDDDSIELDDLDAQEEIIGVNSKMDLPELELDNKHYNPDDLGLCDGSRAGVFEKESNVVGALAHVLSDSPNTESLSITSPFSLSRPKMKDRREGLCNSGEYAESVEKSSSHEKFLGAYSDDSNSIDKVVSGVSDYDDSDLISNEPLIKYVECKRLKKTHKSKKDYRRKTFWSKNPLKAALLSRSVSRDSIRKVSKIESFDGSLNDPTHSIHEEVRSVFRERNSNLIKEARENMKMGIRLGVKYHGRESYNIKKLLELKGIEISEHDIKAEIKALDILEGDASISVEF